MTDAGAYCRGIESYLRGCGGGHPVRVSVDPDLAPHGLRLARLRRRGPGR